MARLPYGKSNLLLDLQKLQKNPIFCISVDILRNTDFFREFTTSANWFTLNADLLRNALEITPVDSAHPFESHPAGEHVMDFVNELGYPEEIHFVSKMHVNNLFQPWRAILTLINQCLTGKTSGDDKTRHPVLQMLWGIVTRSNVDYAELLREEFIQGVQTFFSHRANLKMVAHKPTAKEGGQKKMSSKVNKPTPVKKPTLAKQTKHVIEKSTKPAVTPRQWRKLRSAT
ncbi:hypothetical protein Tco_1103940 [Tanacetum coccineum]